MHKSHPQTKHNEVINDMWKVINSKQSSQKDEAKALEFLNVLKRQKCTQEDWHYYFNDRLVVHNL